MMNHDDLIIGGFSIPKGKETSINLELPKLYSTPTELPLKVLRGNTGKKVVFISAAIHGDELNGVEIIRRLRKLSLLKKLKGTLILAPIVNPYGVMNLSRYLPDRRDLNRSFPGNTKGSLASRIAKIFFDEIVLKSDFGIDLHTGAVHKSNLPQIRTNIFNEETFKLAKAFEAPLILHSELRDGSLRSEAAENGTPILLYEAGEALRFDENAIRIGVRGIVNVLRENGMLPRKKPTKKQYTSIVTKSSRWIRSSQSGLIRTIKALGESVKEDETIAYIDDPIEDESFEILSPFDGIIIGRLEIPLTQEGDAIFHIAKLDTLTETEDSYMNDVILEQSEIESFDDTYTL